MAAWAHAQRARRVSHGPCGVWGVIEAGVDLENASLQTRRQRSFPLELCHRAFDIKVQDAASTVESDKRHILNFIVGRRGDDLVLPSGRRCNECGRGS